MKTINFADAAITERLDLNDDDTSRRPGRPPNSQRIYCCSPLLVGTLISFQNFTFELIRHSIDLVEAIIRTIHRHLPYQARPKFKR